jgi:hypothetical protein
MKTKNNQAQDLIREIEELIWICREKINREIAARKKAKQLTV